MKNAPPTRKSSRIPKRKEENVSTSEPSKAAVSNLPVASPRGRKRKHYTPEVESTKIQKKTVEGREVDGYCWICHKLGQDKICKSCPRVYHFGCIPKGMDFNPLGSCPECQAQSVSMRKDPPNISRASLKKLLKFALQEALREDVKKPIPKSKSQPTDNNKFCKYFKTWPQGSTNILCQVMDLEYLIDKMNDDINYYLTTAEFFADVKWIYHNSYILHGSDSEITEAALKLEKNFKSELLDIEACSECYSILNSDDYLHADFFTVLCKEPHDIVWAKLRGSPYWPAKCLKICNGHAEVRFFGTHDKSTIPLGQCFRISQKSPNEKDIKQAKYKDAIGELSIYVSNYQRTYGNFRYFPPRTPLEELKSRNMKKSHRKGRQYKSSLDNHDLTDCHLSEAPTEKDGPSCSTIGSVRAKFEAISAATVDSSDSDFHVDASDKNENAPIPARKSVAEPVSVCMDFTTDDEAAPFNSSSKVIKGTKPQPSKLLNSFSESLLDCAPLHQSPIEMQSKSMHFINSKSSDSLPVITSAVSGMMNPTFSAEDPLCFSSQTPGTEPSEMLQEISNLFANHTDGFENPLCKNPLNKEMKHSDDGDDLEIIEEKKKDSPAIDAINRNFYLAQALCQVSASNRPRLQRFYADCIQFAMRSYLHLGLPAAMKWHEENATVHFSQLYERMNQSNEALKKENESLKLANSSLKQENAFFRQDNENLQDMRAKVKEYHQLEQMWETRFENQKKVMNMQQAMQVPSGQSRPDSESLIQTNNPFMEENPLAAKVKEMEKMLADKDDKLKKLDEKVCLLESELISNCVSEQIGLTCSQSVDSQTNLPDDQMFTVKEVQEMKDLETSYEENSSESQEEMLEGESFDNEPSIGHSQILRQQTYTTNIQQNSTVIMYPEDGTSDNGPNVVHQMFDGGRLLMSDCSLVQSIAVVSTPSPLLLSDVMPPPLVLPPCVSRTSAKGKKRSLQRK